MMSLAIFLKKCASLRRLVDHELETVAVGLGRHEIVALAQPAGLDEGADLLREHALQPVALDGLEQRVEVPLLGGADGLAVGPALDALDGEEAGAHAVHDVVERVGRVVGPVHDLALDALEVVERLAAHERPGDLRPAEDPVAHRGLRVVEKWLGGGVANSV